MSSYITIIANDSLFSIIMSVQRAGLCVLLGAFRADIDVSAMRLRRPRRCGHRTGCA